MYMSTFKHVYKNNKSKNIFKKVIRSEMWAKELLLGYLIISAIIVMRYFEITRAY